MRHSGGAERKELCDGDVGAFAAYFSQTSFTEKLDPEVVDDGGVGEEDGLESAGKLRVAAANSRNIRGFAESRRQGLALFRDVWAVHDSGSAWTVKGAMMRKGG